jgi:hypothetical protein
MPLDDKAQSYKIAANKTCTIIPVDLAKQFIHYATIRGLSNREFRFVEEYEMNNNFKAKKNDVNCDKWCKRNKEAVDIINEMRINAIPSTEPVGRWIGLPTLHELKLIMRLTSSLGTDELTNIASKLPQPVKIQQQNSDDKMYIIKGSK